MAYIVDDDKQNDNGQAVDQSQQGQQLTSTSGGASAIVNTGEHGSSNTAGMGAGGSGGWTNIQSYLDANQGSQQASAGLAKQKVGTEFQSEASKLASESNAAKQTAMDDVTKNTMTTDQAKQKVGSLSSQYNYKAPQSGEYTAGIGQLKNASTYQYGGPQSYSYALGAKAQNYGDSTKNDNSWSQTMSSIYGDAAGGQLGQGAATLQSQLDVNNPYLAQTRQELGTQYDGLKANVDQTNTDTSKALAGYAKTAQDNVAGVNKYFNTQTTDDKKTIANRAMDQRLAEQYLASQGGGDATQLVTQGKADSPYFNLSYTGGNKATLENVSGVDAERNRYNTIEDILGGAKIGKSDTASSFGTLDAQDKGLSNSLLGNSGTTRLADGKSSASAAIQGGAYDPAAASAYERFFNDMQSGNYSDETKKWLAAARGESTDGPGSAKAIADANKNDNTGYWKSVLSMLGAG